MYDFSVSRQAWLFLYAMGFGFFMGLLYDVIRLLRRLMLGRKGVIAQDIIFFLLASVLTFYFLLVYDYGQIRLYSLLAEAVGFLVFYLSFGGFVLRYVDKSVDVVRKFVRLIFSPVTKLFVLIKKSVNKLFRFSGKKAAQIKNKSKMLLKIHKQ